MEERTKAVIECIIEKYIDKVFDDSAFLRDIIEKSAEGEKDEKRELCQKFLGTFGDKADTEEKIKTEFLSALTIFLTEYAEKTISGDKRVHEAIWALGLEGLHNIEDTLEKSDKKEIARHLHDYIFTFDDIVFLDDRSIQKVLREVDTQELAMALKGADSEVQDKIYRNMSKRASDMLKDDIEFLGPAPKSRIFDAQKKICAIIIRLEQAGEIVIPEIDQDMVI